AHRTLKSQGLLSLAHEYVPGPPDRLQHLWLIRIAFDLSSQPHDPEVDASVEHFITSIVGKVQELLPAEHAVGMLCESPEQIEFRIGKGGFVAIGVIESMRRQIENARSHFHDLGLILQSRLRRSWSLLKPAQQASDARENFAKLERLWDVVVSTHLEPD